MSQKFYVTHSVVILFFTLNAIIVFGSLHLDEKIYWPVDITATRDWLA